MSINIRIEDIASELVGAMKLYTDEVTERIEEVVSDRAVKTRNELKRTSPKDTGKYAKSWRVSKLTVVGSRVHSGTFYTIHNLEYSRVHLLEHGHAKRGGGRVAARPHVAPAYKKFVEPMYDEIKSIIRGG